MLYNFIFCSIIFCLFFNIFHFFIELANSPEHTASGHRAGENAVLELAISMADRKFTVNEVKGQVWPYSRLANAVDS